MKYFMTWLLDEKVILLNGAILFVLISMWMKRLEMEPTNIGIVIGLSSNLVGALIRGIVGPNGNLNNNDTPK